MNQNLPPSLVELTLYSIAKNFENHFYAKDLIGQYKKLCSYLAEKILHELNEYYIGVPQHFLKVFTKDICWFHNIDINCHRINKTSVMHFLKGHRIKRLKIKFLKDIKISDWLCFVYWKDLIELSIKGCKVCDNPCNPMDKERIPMMRSIVKFVNLKMLDLSCTAVNNKQLQFLSGKLVFLEDLNISETLVTKIGCLRKLPGLKKIDVSYLKNQGIFRTLNVLIELKHLEFIDISKSSDHDIIMYSNLIWKTKELHFLRNFLKGASLPKLLHLDISGWTVPEEEAA